jgi:hypothetical protein
VMLLGSVALAKPVWHNMPKIMRKDIKRYHRLERKEIRKDERIQKQDDRLHVKQSVSRPSEGSSVS